MTATTLPFAPVATKKAALDLLLTAATVKAVLVSTSYTPDDTDAFLSDVPGGDRVATLTATWSTATFTTGTAPLQRVLATFVLDADLAYTALTGDPVLGMWFYIDTGVAGTSKLLWWVTNQADTTAFQFTPDGTTCTVKAGPVFGI